MNNQVTLAEAVEGVFLCLEEKGYTELTLTSMHHTCLNPPHSAR